MQKIVIGIDQSYTRTGFSIAVNGKLKRVTSIDFKGLKTRTEKRNELRSRLYKVLDKASQKGNVELSVICERIRTFSNFGKKGKTNGGPSGLKPEYLKMTGALIAVIVDTAAIFDVKVYSVDTRSWKSRIVGTSKARVKNGKRDAKGDTVRFVQNLGFDLFIRTNKNGKDLYDDDAADSACMALYGFISGPKLKLEE